MVDSKNPSENTNNILTFLLLIFAYPIGIIVMWLWTKWARWVKILVTLPIILVVLFGFIIGFAATANPNAQIKKAACVKQCQNSQLKETCITQCIESTNAPTSLEVSPTP